MSLPPGFLDELRARTSIARVIERKVAWDQRKSQPAKGDYWACCPFHQEKTSSFHVEDRKGFYYCFGCHAKGDAIAFLKDAEGMDFMEAVETLAREAGMEMPARDPGEAQRSDRRARLAEVMEAAARFFRMSYRASKGLVAREYVERRGLKAETVERFEIGYAPDERTALIDHLKGQGVEEKLIDECGLMRVPEDGRAPYDWFRGRVMFPIRDVRGRCVAFGGRALDPAAPAKYMNSPETLLFDKGRSLYNHGPAREAAGKTGALIVAEGYMDVIALAQAGFDHAVAPLGTAVTEEQLRLVWRLADEPAIALDGDKAGLRAAMRVVDLALPMLEPGKSLRFALMPEGQDPDDLIKASGPGAMRATLDAALPMVELLWRRETEDQVFDSPERRAALDKRLREALGKIPDPSLRAHYGQAIKERRARLFAPPPGAARTGGARPRGGRRDFGPAMPSAALRSSPLARAGGAEADARGREAALLLALVNHRPLADARLDAVEDLEFVCRDLETMKRALISALTGSEEIADRSALLERIERLTGEAPLSILLSIPQARAARFADEEAAIDVAEQGFDETLARHRALLSLARETAEAESDLTAEPGEDVDRRLEAASRRKFREAAPSPPDANEDESRFSERLRELHAAEIWVKRTRSRS